MLLKIDWHIYSISIFLYIFDFPFQLLSFSLAMVYFLSLILNCLKTKLDCLNCLSEIAFIEDVNLEIQDIRELGNAY